VDISRRGIVLGYPANYFNSVGCGSSWGGRFLGYINQPIPGLMVYLAHPSRGPGSPAFTDARGRFLFSAPIDPDPYELMIFWGRELLYRRRVLVNGPGMQDVRIVLR
jgi:hypothetical protein